MSDERDTMMERLRGVIATLEAWRGMTDDQSVTIPAVLTQLRDLLAFACAMKARDAALRVKERRLRRAVADSADTHA